MDQKPPLTLPGWGTWAVGPNPALISGSCGRCTTSLQQAARTFFYFFTGIPQILRMERDGVPAWRGPSRAVKHPHLPSLATTFGAYPEAPRAPLTALPPFSPVAFAPPLPKARETPRAPSGGAAKGEWKSRSNNYCFAPHRRVKRSVSRKVVRFVLTTVWKDVMGR